MAPWVSTSPTVIPELLLCSCKLSLFSLFCVYFFFYRLLRASIVIASSQTKPPLFVLFCSHTMVLFLLFPNSVKSFTHFVFQILAYFVIYFLRCDAHSFGLMCPHSRIPDLESWSSLSTPKITSAFSFCTFLSFPPAGCNFNTNHQQLDKSQALF